MSTEKTTVRINMCGYPRLMLRWHPEDYVIDFWVCRGIGFSFYKWPGMKWKRWQ